MLAPTLFMLLLGLTAGVMLAIASRVFYVAEDPRALAIADALPGANCGGCGFAGCSAAAAAVAAGAAGANVCVVGGVETARAVASVTGETVTEREPRVAWTSCSYGVDEADPLYRYDGALDCRAAALLYGGSKLCPIGCLGLGTCVKVCEFDAVVMGEGRLPVFDPDRCVACGACVRACPKHIIGLTSATDRIVDEYTVDECTAPCQRACPTHIDITAYLRAVREGRFEDGLRIIKERCPLPLVCGRICPAPCELECRRGRADEAVGINPVKRFLAEQERRTGRYVQPYRSPDSGHRAAVIGGGAEGLTVAYFLARLGHRPVIFEAGPELGGILRTVISPDRLPPDVLDHDIAGILDMGVDARCGQRLGRDFGVASLLDEGFDLVVCCTGGYDGRKLLGLGPDVAVPGLALMVDVLAAEASGRVASVGAEVAIVEGLARALVVARRCRASGAAAVRVVSRRPLPLWPEELQDERALEAEGIHLAPGRVVAALGGEGDRLTALVLEDATAADPAVPRRQRFAVDTLILGGARLPELVLQRVDPAEGAARRWQTVETFRTLPFGGDGGVFSSPEIGRVSDSTAVVRSIASGRRVVRGLQQHLLTGRVERLPGSVAEAASVLDVAEVAGVPALARERVQGGLAGFDPDWKAVREVPGLEEAAARREAGRCLDCGLICYRREVAVQHG